MTIFSLCAKTIDLKGIVAKQNKQCMLISDAEELMFFGLFHV
jgi:hypothetical protein